MISMKKMYGRCFIPSALMRPRLNTERRGNSIKPNLQDANPRHPAILETGVSKQQTDQRLWSDRNHSACNLTWGPLYSEPRGSIKSDRYNGRAVCRRGRNSQGLPEPAGTNGRTIHQRPVQHRTGCQAVQNR